MKLVSPIVIPSAVSGLISPGNVPAGTIFELVSGATLVCRKCIADMVPDLRRRSRNRAGSTAAREARCDLAAVNWESGFQGSETVRFIGEVEVDAEDLGLRLKRSRNLPMIEEEGKVKDVVLVMNKRFGDMNEKVRM